MPRATKESDPYADYPIKPRHARSSTAPPKKPREPKPPKSGVNIVRDPGSADIWISGFKTFSKKEDLKQFIAVNYPENSLRWDGDNKRWVMKCALHTTSDIWNFDAFKKEVLQAVFEIVEAE